MVAHRLHPAGSSWGRRIPSPAPTRHKRAHRMNNVSSHGRARARDWSAARSGVSHAAVGQLASLVQLLSGLKSTTGCGALEVGGVSPEVGQTIRTVHSRWKMPHHQAWNTPLVMSPTGSVTGETSGAFAWPVQPGSEQHSSHLCLDPNNCILRAHLAWWRGPFRPGRANGQRRPSATLSVGRRTPSGSDCVPILPRLESCSLARTALPTDRTAADHQVSRILPAAAARRARNKGTAGRALRAVACCCCQPAGPNHHSGSRPGDEARGGPLRPPTWRLGRLACVGEWPQWRHARCGPLSRGPLFPSRSGRAWRGYQTVVGSERGPPFPSSAI